MIIDKFHISLFNILNEIVYIYDFETKNVLFLNNIGKQKLNIKNNIPLKSDIKDSTFFNNFYSIKIDDFDNQQIISFNGYSYRINKTLCTYENKKVILCVCNEIKYDIEKDRHNLEMNDILISSISSLSKDKETFKIIYEVLEKVGLYYNADKCYIKETISDKNHNMHYYKWESITIQNKVHNEIFEDEEIQKWEQVLGNKELLLIEDKEELKEKWEEKYLYCKSKNINNILICKMILDGKSYGILCIENLAKNMKDVSLLKSLTYFILNELKRRKISKNLTFMSFHDAYTGLNNRNKYLNYINNIKYENIQSVGVVFIDINGLKVINDTKGHEFGDRAICEVSECLKRNFRKGDAYRIGGDEFVIISENISRKTFLEKVNHINRHFLELKEYSISIGYIWQDKNIDITELTHKADSYMYEAKKTYYKENNEKQEKIYSCMATQDTKNENEIKVVLGKELTFEFGDKSKNIKSKQDQFKIKINQINLSDEDKKIMVMFDINNFKAINEMYGFDEGNNILVAINDIIDEILAGKGICYNSYSDVYYFCCVSNDDNTTYNILNEINYKIDEYIEKIKITLSYGIYRMNEEYVSIEQAMERASYAHKISKKDNTKNITFYSDTLKDIMLNEKQIEDDMDEALETNQFKLYLQPKYNVYTNEINGAEALVRWIHPVKGLMSPAKFIPVFEKNGFIIKLDMYILEEVCKFIKQNQEKGRRNIPISINISKLNFRRKNFKDYIMSVINKYGINPSLIELEITESLIAEEPEEIIKVINDFKKENVAIAMDDFGTGYSSLSILQFLPVDVLKIDCGFFKEFEKTKRGAAIIKSIVNLAKELELGIVAEGVETVQEVEYLKEIDCDTIQGYYFCKPIPVDEFEKRAFSE